MQCLQSLTNTETPMFGINYIDWDEITKQPNIKPVYYSKPTDDLADILEDQEIYFEEVGWGCSQ